MLALFFFLFHWEIYLPLASFLKKLLALKVISINSHTHGVLLYFYQFHFIIPIIIIIIIIIIIWILI